MLKAIKKFQIHHNLLKYWFTLFHFVLGDPVFRVEDYFIDVKDAESRFKKWYQTFIINCQILVKIFCYFENKLTTTKLMIKTLS